MNVLSLTPVVSHGHALEICARHNLSFVDTAYYALASDQIAELEILEQLASEDLPVRILMVDDVHDLRSTFEQARARIARLHNDDSALLVLSTNDLLTSRIDTEKLKESKYIEFSIVRHFTYIEGLGRKTSPTNSPSLRIDRAEESFAFGLTQLNSKHPAYIVDDPLTGAPNLIDRRRNTMPNFSIIKLPIMNVEQFLLETVESWLAFKQRNRARRLLRNANQPWFEKSRLMLESYNGSLDTGQLEAWFEEQITNPETASESIELDLSSIRPVTDSYNLLQIGKMTVSALDSAHQFELNQLRDLRRERLRRLLDGLSILLADLPWSKTWVWRDRAAVLERSWNGVTIAFDVFLTSDEITVQLVSRQKEPLPEIKLYLAKRGLPEVGVAGKPGRYVVGAVQLKSSDFSVKETRTVANLIRTIAEGMTDRGTP